MGRLSRLLKTGSLDDQLWNRGFTKGHRLYNDIDARIKAEVETKFGIKLSEFDSAQSAQYARRVINNPTIRTLLDALQKANPRLDILGKFNLIIEGFESDITGFLFTTPGQDALLNYQRCGRSDCGAPPIE